MDEDEEEEAIQRVVFPGIGPHGWPAGGFANATFGAGGSAAWRFMGGADTDANAQWPESLIRRQPQLK